MLNLENKVIKAKNSLFSLVLFDVPEQ